MDQQTPAQPSRSRRRTLIALAGAALGAGALPRALAQAAYPSRTVRLVVPFPAGGGADFMGRQIARRLGEDWKQTVVVENKAGAAGIIGSMAVAKSPPDGYTLLLATTGTHSTNPVTYSDLPYHPLRDFSTVAIFADAPFVLCVHAGLNIRTLEQLVKYSQANPEALTYGSAGLGSSTHLGFEALRQATGIRARHVPYKGLPPAMVDTLSGHVSMTFDSIPSALPHLKAGRVHIIGVGSPERVPSLPDVPTLAEQAGGFTLGSWYGLFAPAKTPPEIVLQVNASVARIAEGKDFQQNLATVGATPLIAPPDRASAYLSRDIDRWRKVATDLNIKVVM